MARHAEDNDMQPRCAMPHRRGLRCLLQIRRGDAEISIGIPAERLERTTPLIPMGRPGTAMEAAGAIFFFASPFSDYVSGQVLEVTGGL